MGVEIELYTNFPMRLVNIWSAWDNGVSAEVVEAVGPPTPHLIRIFCPHVSAIGYL